NLQHLVDGILEQHDIGIHKDQIGLALDCARDDDVRARDKPEIHFVDDDIYRKFRANGATNLVQGVHEFPVGGRIHHKNERQVIFRLVDVQSKYRASKRLDQMRIL